MQSLIQKCDGVGVTDTYAKHYATIAKDTLNTFNDGKVKDALCELVDYIIVRAY
jgi:geranylgeranyl pyrophosphate synthase